MKTPEFAERQFETAIYIELSREDSSPFVPTQNVEKYLGIDAAADPDRLHAIWRILDVQIPQRVPLSPTLWPFLPRRFHPSLPTARFCSLFLQVKVANYQDGPRSKYYGKFSGPYFETKITAHQQKTLKALETRLQERAITRYVSPVFWSRNDFDAHDRARRVLQNSAFIAPSVVKAHRKWMYNSASGLHVLNPDPEEIGPESWEALAASIQERAREETLFEHVRALATSIGGELVDGGLEQATWIGRLRQYGEFGGETISLLYYLSVVAQYAELAGVWWLLLLIPDSNTRELLRHRDQHWWYWWHRFM
jgi:hypothetical protein